MDNAFIVGLLCGIMYNTMFTNYHLAKIRQEIESEKSNT